jgi:hypothetical protein
MPVESVRQRETYGRQYSRSGGEQLQSFSAVEVIAGGPLFVGNDMVNMRLPPLAGDSEEARENFGWPPALDDLVPNWRTAKEIAVENPYLVY